MPTSIETDKVTGVATTGHEWDGIKELDTPMPKWWVYVFIATAVWALGYCLLYPSVPYGPGYFKGLLGYSSRDRVNTEIAAVGAGRKDAMAAIATQPWETILGNPELRALALAAGRITFAENCAQCHGAGGAGRTGYPALAAGGWIWGGTLPEIETTLAHGIRSADPDARRSQMPRFGLDGILSPTEVQQVTDHVWSTFYGHAPAPGAPAPAAAGAEIYAANCAACHGARGEGNREMGAPRLASRVHLYGDSRAQVVTQIHTGRAGVMPNWNTRLDAATLRSVALYVHALGGGE